jgi:excisionase family DNA binding protein
VIAAWHPGTVESIEWLTVPEAAERLGVTVSRVHQMIRDASLAAARDNGGPARIPAGFLDGDVIVKHLGGVLTVLRDAGFSDEEAVRWLHTADETLPGTPIEALRGDRSREVKRRAQALGF